MNKTPSQQTGEGNAPSTAWEDGRSYQFELMLPSLTDKQLTTLYKETRSVKANRQRDHELVRREMKKRGNLISV
jgi:hypothetical protein